MLTSDPWQEACQILPDVNTLTRAAAEQAYEQAGLGPEDLDLVDLHDCCATAELVHYDNLKLCPEGGAADFFNSGATWRDGSMPVNVSGGLESKGHPIAATGIANVWEVATHLRGEAGDRPGRQVELLAHQRDDRGQREDGVDRLRPQYFVLAAVNATRRAEVAARVGALGRTALPVHCDVTLDADVENLRDRTLERFGRVDVLFNNAGVSVSGPPERVDMADWMWILQVNVLGLVRGVRAFVPGMLERGQGHVVNTASVAGVWAYTWDAAPYITSKFAAYGFTEALARRLRPQGVWVSVLCPGLVKTNLVETVRVSGLRADERPDWFYFPPEMMQPVEAADVGVLAADAVETGTFAVFTHPEDAERFRSWRQDIDASL
nr:SDR family NAD(P)-dependent oxidoreductase [Micromonospora sp. DSM 115978]